MNRSKIKNLLSEDINCGFSLILPINIVEKLQNISISPLGCQEQDTINQKGETTVKHRRTHDQSFLGPSGASTNSKVIEEHLPPCKYGRCLKRLLNYIASLCLRHPSTPIYLSKFDFDTAFRRCHISPQTAFESCCILENFLFISLHLPFGGIPCPNLWESFSQPICDIANELIQNSQWDHKKLFDPISLHLSVPKRLPPETPLGHALPLAIEIPENDLGKGNIYIDDSIFVCPDLLNNTDRISRAVPLAINCLARPVSSSEPLDRKSLISMKKFLAEASLEECKTILGWSPQNGLREIKQKGSLHSTYCPGRLTAMQKKSTLGKNRDINKHHHFPLSHSISPIRRLRIRPRRL